MKVLAHRQTTTDKEASWEPSQLAAGAGFEPARGFPLMPITQTQRPVEIDAPDGNRTHVSRTDIRAFYRS